VTCFARKRINADAAILFADLLLIAEPLGVKLTFAAGEGPLLEPAVRDAAAVDRLREVDPDELAYVYDAVRAVRRDLEPGIPLIGLPFYLVDPRFHAYEEEHADDLEDAERIMAGLRHEAGHAVTYAYRIYEDPEYTALFGDFFAVYDDDYRPGPWSRRLVRHLPGWYAQKHADEDFAETFAVWLTPGLDWREESSRFSCKAFAALRRAEMKLQAGMGEVVRRGGWVHMHAAHGIEGRFAVVSRQAGVIGVHASSPSHLMISPKWGDQDSEP